eukprot:TRINITY_DN1381_c0_g1_i1.p1 TRINITY_DN1381_c0_g1~~TRINITY_DN1381_c0_g1_i1.p1  ORF type:complete len:250 (+),score=56.66 TRINITY_DN1381_c0_g1_i1:152-901(+)
MCIRDRYQRRVRETTAFAMLARCARLATTGPSAVRPLNIAKTLSGAHLSLTRASSNVPAASNFEGDLISSNYDKPLAPLGDPSKRAFTYVVLGGARFIYASAARLVAIKFIATMSASADVLALASTEVDLSSIEAGSSVTVKWRGKPVFIRHRSEDEIASAVAVDVATLRDPETDDVRVQDPEWLVVLGVCTHLGCVPLAGAGDFGGYFCPCHGSHYDTSGRIRKGPAPLNLEVPGYELDTDANSLLIG